MAIATNLSSQSTAAVGSAQRAQPLRPQQGIVFIELGASILLVLAIAFVALWAGLMLNARATLTTAISQATRLAAARAAVSIDGDGRPVGVNVGTNPALLDEALSQDSQLLFSTANLPLTDAQAFYDANLMTRRSTAEEGLFAGGNRLPREYRLAIVYLVAALRENLGGTVRFPCIPGIEPVTAQSNWLHQIVLGVPAHPSSWGTTTPVFSPQRDGAGCVACEFLPPCGLQSTGTGACSPTAAPTAPWRGPLVGGTSAVSRTIVLQCTYQPAAAFMKPVTALLRAFDINSLEWVTVSARGVFHRGEEL